MRQAKAGKGNYFFKSGVLFHREKISDQWVEQLMLPQTRHMTTEFLHIELLTMGTVEHNAREQELSYISTGQVFAKTCRTLFLDAETVLFTWVLGKVIMYQSLRLCDLPYLL